METETAGVYVIIVDDDAQMRDTVNAYLSDEGFAVGEAADGESMRRLIDERTPDLVLLDLRLPGADGLTLARELHDRLPEVAIVMVSGKEDVVDRVAGLEVGADDYVVKPFHLRELLARIRSVLRRRERIGNGHGRPLDDRTRGHTVVDPVPRVAYRFSDWTLDSGHRTLTARDGRPVELTNGEFDLLLAFVSHPNRALTRDQLLDYAGSNESESCDRSIDVRVARLRRKIEPYPKRPVFIKTIRTVGYMFTADVTVSED